MAAALDGVVLADKPAGITSHDVVDRARRALGRRRVGHAGTLDPFATGLLLILVGRATRLQRYLMALPKTYEVVARFGAVSSTGDPDGEIIETGVVPAALTLPTGALRQRPPVYSAVKVGGERAYKRARRGEDVELGEREVHVAKFDLLWREADRAGFRIVCSSGTYVRSLIADLGDAYCLELRRTAIGPFTVVDAAPPVWPAAAQNRSEPGRGAAPTVLSIADALRFMPHVPLEGDQARRAAHGAGVPAPDASIGGPVLLVDAAGPIAVADVRERDGQCELKPKVGLRDG
jgi:tRNA pseudouridine55 synthase